MKVKTLSLVFLFMAATAAAQVLFVDENLNTDSLTALVSSKNGTEHVEVLNLLSNALCTENPDSSLILANQAIDLSEKLGYPKGRADGFVNRGNFYFLRDSLEPTISDFLKAIRIYETLPPSRAFGELCMVYGLINLYAGSSDIRETHYTQAKSIFEKTGDTASLGVACYFLGRWKTFNGEWDSSRYYHNLSFSYLADGSNPFIVGWDYIGIENSYRMQFYETGDTNYLHLAISTLFDALKQPEIEGDTRALYYISLSQDYREFNTKKGIAASRHYLEEASHMADTSNLASGYKDEILSRLASLCLLEGDYKGAIELCERSLEITEAELAADPMELHPTPMISLNKKMLHIVNKKRANKYLYKAWSALGDYKQAHEHYVLAKLAEEELTQEKNEKLIAMMEATSLAEKTQGQIDLLARDNDLKALKLKQSRGYIFGIGGMFVIFLLIGLLFLRQNKLKNDNKTVVLEQKLLRSQMNPHFIFNSLANIQEFIWNKDPLSANEYLSSFSKLVRLILENSRSDFVSVAKEISTIENYLKLQKLRFSDKLEYTIDIDPQIDEEEMLIPPMLVQPFIENSIEHGISHRETTGHVHVRFFLQDDQINIEVKDNGIGFKQSSELKKDKKKDHQSLAMTITQERLLMHFKKHKRKIQLTISDLMDDNQQVTGAHVVFGIPFNFA